jgi:hypothetical protein
MQRGRWRMRRSSHSIIWKEPRCFAKLEHCLSTEGVHPQPPPPPPHLSFKGSIRVTTFLKRLTFKSCATSNIRDKSTGSPFMYQSAIAWITRCRMDGDDWPWK